MYTKAFAIRCLPYAKAVISIKNKIYNKTSDIDEQMDCSQWNKIVKIYDGIPKLFTMPAAVIHCRKDIHKAYHIAKINGILPHLLSSSWDNEISISWHLICGRFQYRYANKKSTCHQRRRATVTKNTNIIARVYENRLPRPLGNKIQNNKCKSNWKVVFGKR